MVKKKDSKNDNNASANAWEMESISSQATGTSTNTTNRDDDDNDDDASSVSNVELQDSLEKLDERTDLEKKAFDLLDEGDLAALTQLVSEQKQNIDLSHKNMDGHDMLTHAVGTGKKKLVQLVLSIDPLNVDIKEALLHAIREDKMGIMLKLLYFEDSRSGGAFYATTKQAVTTLFKSKKQKKGKKGDKMAVKIAVQDTFDQSEYGNDITPLMMAAKHERYEIMQVLYNRGERLPLLHMPSCSCRECKGATRDLERTRKRINLLEAMTSPTYMVFMAGQDGSFDPVYEAFELCQSVEQCRDEEPEFKDEYEKILEDVKRLPLELLKLCRTVDETKIFLSQKEGYIGPSSMPYPRLAVAIEMDHKEIVAHPNVQFLLQTEFNGPIWKEVQSDWERSAKQLISLLQVLFFWAFQALLWFSLFCCSKLPMVQYLQSPRSKALSRLGTYLYFCALLFIINSQERPEADYEPGTMYARWIVPIVVLSLLVSLFRRFMLHPGAFFKSGWNKWDCITQLFFWISFAFYVIVLWKKSQLGFEEMLPRRKLDAYDPLLLAECAFAVASTFCTCVLLRWFVFSPSIGPFQVACYRMGYNLKTVLIYVAWIVATFTTSSQIIFRPYVNLTKYDDKELKMVDQPTDMTDPVGMFIGYLAGDLGPGAVEIFTVNRTFINAEGKEETVENEQETTQWFATFLCVVWNVVGIAFLKDSIIGLFGSAGDQAMEEKDTEWKYDRAKEMIYYIQDGHLAPPFNLLPNGACLASMVRWIAAMASKKNGNVEAGCNCGECCYLRDVESPEETEERRRLYPWLLRNLFQRYFKLRGDDDDDKAQKQDVTDVQEQVKEVKELCKELLGIKIPSRKNSNGSGGGRSPGAGPSGGGLPGPSVVGGSPLPGPSGVVSGLPLPGPSGVVSGLPVPGSSVVGGSPLPGPSGVVSGLPVPSSSTVCASLVPGSSTVCATPVPGSSGVSTKVSKPTKMSQLS